MEEAISKFMDGLVESECKGFVTLHRLLVGLPLEAASANEDERQEHDTHSAPLGFDSAF